MIEQIVTEIERHGIRVELRFPVSADEDLGRISGSTIEVVNDPLETVTAFTLCHLFGHMVQFTNLHRYKHLIDAVSPAPPICLSPEFWQEFYTYEREAFGYGACVLENTALANDTLGGQYATFMELDFDNFREYVSTGKRLNRTEYREALLLRFALSSSVSAPIQPLPVAGIEWPNLANIEATIY